MSKPTAGPHMLSKHRVGLNLMTHHQAPAQQHETGLCYGRVGLIPLLSRSKPYITAQPARPLSAAKRSLAQLDLDSDTDSDAPPPSPRCRRRRLFPVSLNLSGKDCGSPPGHRAAGELAELAELAEALQV